MIDTRSNRFTPVTVGMAIALFMLALVVDKANAAITSVCNQCIAVADRDAKKYCGDPNSSTYYQCYMGPDGFSKFKKERCEDTKICPNAKDVGLNTDCGSSACRFGSLPKGFCNNDAEAGTICANECYQMGCDPSGAKGCYDIKATDWEKVPKIQNSL